MSNGYKEGLSLIIRRLSFNSNWNFIILLFLHIAYDYSYFIYNIILLWLIRLTNCLKMGWSLRPKRRAIEKNTWICWKIKISCTFLHLIGLIELFTKVIFQFQLKTPNLQMNVTKKIYNQFHNILRLSNVLPNFLFTTSETGWLLLINMEYTSCLTSCWTT